MEVCSKGRLYTTRDQRERLGIADGNAGTGTSVTVGVMYVDRSPDWSGAYAQHATFEAELAYDGEVYVPNPLLRRLGLEQGDSVRVLLDAPTVEDFPKDASVMVDDETVESDVTPA